MSVARSWCVPARDIVAIGASAGGVDALPAVLAQLPRDLPASVFVVLHLPPSPDPYLVEILRRASTLPVAWADQGERIERGRVYVAPPDTHMVFTDHHLRLTRTARENHARPSIDKLFRSAAACFGDRTIGVLMTGMLDDGVAGLVAIRRVDGRTIVQDPKDAAFPDLPANALAVMMPDRVAKLAEVAPAIVALTREPAQGRHPDEPIRTEAALDASSRTDDHALARIGHQTTVRCPDCGGPLWALGDDHHRRFRCYLGHATSAHRLLGDQADRLETVLWRAVRTLHDHGETLTILAADARRLGNPQLADAYDTRARAAHDNARRTERLLQDLTRR